MQLNHKRVRLFLWNIVTCLCSNPWNVPERPLVFMLCGAQCCTMCMSSLRSDCEACSLEASPGRNSARSLPHHIFAACNGAASCQKPAGDTFLTVTRLQGKRNWILLPEKTFTLTEDVRVQTRWSQGTKSVFLSFSHNWFYFKRERSQIEIDKVSRTLQTV